MSITATLAKMKNYFETWHTKEYDRLHTAYDDSSVQGLIEDIKSKLPKDQFGNITQIYSKSDVDNFISNLNTQITGVRNNLSNYYNKTEIDGFVGSLESALNNKFSKNEAGGGWKKLDDEQTIPGGWASSNLTIYVNDAIHMGHLNFAMPFDSATKGKFYEWNYINLPTKYRPNGAVFGACRIEPSNNSGGSGGDVGVLAIKSNGKLGGVFGMSWSNTDARTVYGSVFWRF